MTVGAVGPPGKRVFYLQAREGSQLLSLKLEKEQVLFLAGGLSQVLADLASPASVPADSDLELEEPVDPEWAVGSLQLAYDRDADRVVLVARETGGLEPDEAEDDEGPLEDEEAGPAELPGPGSLGAAPELSRERDEANGGVARVALTREQAAGVIAHGRRLLQAGRPPCPLCGFPLGEDHSCPKANGHRSPAL